MTLIKLTDMEGEVLLVNSDEFQRVYWILEEKVKGMGPHSLIYFKRHENVYSRAKETPTVIWGLVRWQEGFPDNEPDCDDGFTDAFDGSLDRLHKELVENERVAKIVDKAEDVMYKKTETRYEGLKREDDNCDTTRRND